MIFRYDVTPGNEHGFAERLVGLPIMRAERVLAVITSVEEREGYVLATIPGLVLPGAEDMRGLRGV